MCALFFFFLPLGFCLPFSGFACGLQRVNMCGQPGLNCGCKFNFAALLFFCKILLFAVYELEALGFTGNVLPSKKMCAYPALWMCLNKRLQRMEHFLIVARILKRLLLLKQVEVQGLGRLDDVHMTCVTQWTRSTFCLVPMNACACSQLSLDVQVPSLGCMCSACVRTLSAAVAGMSQLLLGRSLKDSPVSHHRISWN